MPRVGHVGSENFPVLDIVKAILAVVDSALTETVDNMMCDIQHARLIQTERRSIGLPVGQKLLILYDS